MYTNTFNEELVDNVLRSKLADIVFSEVNPSIMEMIVACKKGSHKTIKNNIGKQHREISSTKRAIINTTKRKEKDAFYCTGCKKTLPKRRFRRKSRLDKSRKPFYPDGTPKYESRCMRCRQLTTKYGLTGHQYETMLINQEGKCLICEEPATCVDHSHTTNAIRGLLCIKCNAGIGQFNESPTLLQKAANYIIATAKKETT